MKTIAKDLGLAALISFLIVLPFMILEWINHRNLQDSCLVWLAVALTDGLHRHPHAYCEKSASRKQHHGESN